MKSKHIVLLGLFLSALTSCVFEDDLVQATPPVDVAVAVEQVEPKPVEMEQVEIEQVEPATAISELSPPATDTVKVTLPGQYKVEYGDTLRDIAAHSGIYWSGPLWINIYNANRDQIANPDLILPGIVLLIPSLRDEIREGMWEAGRDYENPFTR
jgi:nucleoid-associated protein YgaU